MEPCCIKVGEKQSGGVEAAYLCVVICVLRSPLPWEAGIKGGKPVEAYLVPWSSVSWFPFRFFHWIWTFRNFHLDMEQYDNWPFL